MFPPGWAAPARSPPSRRSNAGLGRFEFSEIAVMTRCPDAAGRGRGLRELRESGPGGPDTKQGNIGYVTRNRRFHVIQPFYRQFPGFPEVPTSAEKGREGALGGGFPGPCGRSAGGVGVMVLLPPFGRRPGSGSGAVLLSSWRLSERRQPWVSPRRTGWFWPVFPGLRSNGRLAGRTGGPPPFMMGAVRAPGAAA